MALSSDFVTACLWSEAYEWIRLDFDRSQNHQRSKHDTKMIVCNSTCLQSPTNAMQVSARQPCVFEDLFLPSHRCLTTPSWGTHCNIYAIYTSLKNAFSGLQFRRWQYGSIFIRLTVIASEKREMSRNSKRIWPYSSSRSSKVIDLGVNGKPICDFLLVSNCNFVPICYRFRDIDA